MKETGLMFKAPLVRAILSGQKAQTRRIYKLETVTDDTFMGGYYLKLKDGMNLAIGSEHVHIACPTGGPGDRIYVRETFVQGYKEDRDRRCCINQPQARFPQPQTWLCHSYRLRATQLSKPIEDSDPNVQFVDLPLERA